MVDTVRTVAALQALLADNTNGDISPQDLRDLLVSAMNQLTAGHQSGWKDVVMPLNMAGVPAANRPALAAFGVSGLREEMQFALDDYAFVGALHIDHDIKPDSDLFLHVHWSTDGTSTDTVKWEFQVMQAKGHNQENFPAPTVITIEQAGQGTAWRHMIAEVATAITIAEPDELLLVTLRRITNGATDNSDGVFGITVDAHYQSDRGASLNRTPDFYT